MLSRRSFCSSARDLGGWWGWVGRGDWSGLRPYCFASEGKERFYSDWAKPSASLNAWE